jgi:hypothetical protein
MTGEYAASVREAQDAYRERMPDNEYRRRYLSAADRTAREDAPAVDWQEFDRWLDSDERI